jgi:hypothetical protein
MLPVLRLDGLPGHVLLARTPATRPRTAFVKLQEDAAALSLSCRSESGTSAVAVNARFL